MKKSEEKALYLKTALRAAHAAGKIITSGLGKNKNIRFKGSAINLVTDIDKQSEEKIKTIIRKKFPEHGILAEESDIENEMAKHLWVIDPLDGTTNYAHEYPCFSISIALEVKRIMEIGVVYNPVHKEMFYAVRGKGAFLNGKRLHVSKIKKVQQGLLVAGFPYDIGKMHINYFNHFLMKAQGVRRDGSAALDLCYVAAGRLDGFFELGLMPWDTAAGSIIVKEAGGKISTFSGDKFSIYGKECLASNGTIQQELIKEFKAIRTGKIASPA